jgi:adenosylhomocysteine nucleosidase
MMLNFRRVFLAVTVVALFVFTPPGAKADNGPIALGVATDYEFKILLETLDREKMETVSARFPLRTLTINGQQIVVFATGPNLTNAASRTQAVIDRYQPRALIFAGVAGGVDVALKVGDVVVPESWGNHAVGMLFSEDGKGGYATNSRYKLPDGVTNFGMQFPLTITTMGADNVRREHRALSADRGLLDRVTALAKRNSSLKLQVGGMGVSGGFFVESLKYKAWLRSNWKALVTDMESVSVVQVCRELEVPCIVFRGVSDMGDASEYRRNVPEAAKNTMRAAVDFIRDFTARPANP